MEVKKTVINSIYGEMGDEESELTDEQKWLRRNYDLIEDADQRALARVCQVLTKEKMVNERWPKFGRRAFWFPDHRWDDAGKPQIVVVWQDRQWGKVRCIVTDDLEHNDIAHNYEPIDIDYAELFWIPDLQDFLTFEEWPGAKIGKEAWVVSSRKVIGFNGTVTNPFVNEITGMDMDADPPGPTNLLLFVALAWLKAYTEKKEK